MAAIVLSLSKYINDSFFLCISSVPPTQADIFWFMCPQFYMLEPFHKNPVTLQLFRGAKILIESSE